MSPSLRLQQQSARYSSEPSLGHRSGSHRSVMSASSSPSHIREIVIKPLTFCHRQDNVISRGKSRPTTSAIVRYDSSTHDELLSSPDSLSDEISSPTSTTTPTSTATPSGHHSRLHQEPKADGVSSYSEQSIRYVAEQVALEQARQLKKMSNVQTHRVDRRYFISGCSLSSTPKCQGHSLRQRSAYTAPQRRRTVTSTNFSPSDTSLFVKGTNKPPILVGKARKSTYIVKNRDSAHNTSTPIVTPSTIEIPTNRPSAEPCKPTSKPNTPEDDKQTSLTAKNTTKSEDGHHSGISVQPTAAAVTFKLNDKH